MNYLQALSSRRSLALLGAALALLGAPLVTAAPADVDPEYWDVVMGRADAIVAEMELDDAAKAERVQKIIARHYADLNRIHDGRDAAVKAIRDNLGDFEGMAEPAIEALQRGSDLEVREVYYAFLGKLSVELTDEQITAVKDGLTYGVVPMTYANYMKMLPELEEVHRKQILAWLVEAREYAVNAGSSGAKHGWFNKYKGKITNYLSALEIDMKEAEKRLFE